MMKRGELVLFLGILTILLVCALTSQREEFSSLETIRQEIYQVRGQLCVVSTVHTRDGPKTVNHVVVMLRNAKGEDFQVKIPELLPENTFFVKPMTDEKGNRILVSIPTIVQEQEESR